MEWGVEAQATLWGAGATLLTGLLAVGGAVYVGIRQAAIQAKQTTIADHQTKILDRQAALAELTLRSDLFEKRHAVYLATNDLIVAAMREGASIEYGDPVERPFLVAKDAAQFLFRPAVAEGLQEVWSKVCEGTALRQEMKAIYEREGHYGEGNPERQLAVSLWMSDRLTTLSDLFGHELKLSDHDMRLG